MKHHGSRFECGRERDEDLLRAYREQIGDCRVIRMPDVFRAVVEMPSRRFWVSEERAAVVVAGMLRGDTLEGMRHTKREMFREIFRRFLLFREECPGLTLIESVSAVVRQGAPRFYLTAGSAKVIFYKIRKERRARREAAGRRV